MQAALSVIWHFRNIGILGSSTGLTPRGLTNLLKRLGLGVPHPTYIN